MSDWIDAVWPDGKFPLFDTEPIAVGKMPELSMFHELYPTLAKEAGIEEGQGMSVVGEAGFDSAKELARALDSVAFYKRRADLLQRLLGRMREPERTMVVDVLANGTLLPDPDGKRYGKQEAKP